MPCDQEGIHHTTVSLGYGMIGEAWYCDKHLPKLDDKENEE